MRHVDATKLQILSELRRKTGLSQTEVARLFGLSDKQGRKTISDWESGKAIPNEERRERFIQYFKQDLGLRDDPTNLANVWHILVEEWGWEALTEEEQSKLSSNGVPSLIPEFPLSHQPITEKTSSITRTKWTRWITGIFLITFVLLAIGAFLFFKPASSSCTGSVPASKLGASFDLNCEGLALIQDYDLWFTSDATGHWQIWRLDTHLRNVQPIDFELNGKFLALDQFSPAISPDGTHIAFAAGECSKTKTCYRDLYLATIDGQDTKQLTNSSNQDEYHPAWSPDGKHLAYHAGNISIPYGIWVIDLSNGNSHQLTSRGEYDPVWSPSGRYIAYHTAGLSKIQVLDYQTCGPKENSCETWDATNNSGFPSTSAAWVNDHKLTFASSKDGHWNIYEIPVTSDVALPRRKPLQNPIPRTQYDFDNVYPAVFDAQLMLWQAFPHETHADTGSEVDRYAEIYVMNLATGQMAALITGIENARNGFLTVRH